MNIQIKEFRPPESLQQYVEFFWSGEFNIHGGSTLSQKVVPNGYVELVIHLSDLHCDLCRDGVWSQSPEYTIIGLHTRPYVVQFGSRVFVFGIRFKPEGVYNLFGIPAAEFSGTYEDMEQVLGRGFREFCSRLREAPDTAGMIILAERYLLAQAERTRLDIGYVNRAAELIRQSRGFMRIEDVSGKVFISTRQLEREFRHRMGMSPKLYMRLARLNEVQRQLDANRPLDFMEITYNCGYTDQAHFIRDFKAFTGEKPTLFTRNRQEFLVNPGLA